MLPATSAARRFITAFVTVFATVIALTKDLPDIVGDRQHGIQTFATMLGAPRLTALGARRGSVIGNPEYRLSTKVAGTMIKSFMDDRHNI